MRVLLHGCNGKMGQVMTWVLALEKDMEIVAGVDADPRKCDNRYPVYASLGEAAESPLLCGHGKPDLLIDFSHHSTLDGLLEYGLAYRIPLLICTTGFTPTERQKMVEASTKIAILNSANMSLGVNLVLSLVRQAASLLQGSFDIEIVEKHHNQKVDAPSGTAIMIAEAIGSEVPIHSVRGGAIVGVHEVIFAGQGEVIEISHQALSRDVFAYGAVRAARFLAGKEPRLYSMSDVIGSH